MVSREHIGSVGYVPFCRDDVTGVCTCPNSYLVMHIKYEKKKCVSEGFSLGMKGGSVVYQLMLSSGKAWL